MKYQSYVTGRKQNGEYEFRRFYCPVTLQDGKWMPASLPVEDTHFYPQVELAMDVAEYDTQADAECGDLEDIPRPAGWSVLCRHWLPDDYVPPTAEELKKQEAEARDYFRTIFGR